jgi:hypothetical protein
VATVEHLILVTLVTVIGMVSAVAFYRSLSAPDPLVRVRRFIGRRRWPRSVRLVTEVVVGLVVAVVLVFLWVSAINVTLFFVLPIERVAELALLSYVIVAASRVLTFLTPSGGRELAKTVPLALVVLILIGEPLTEATLAAKAQQLDEAIPDETALMLSLIGLELVLQSLWRLRSRAVANDRPPEPSPLAPLPPTGEAVEQPPASPSRERSQQVPAAVPTRNARGMRTGRSRAWIFAATIVAIAAYAIGRATEARTRSGARGRSRRFTGCR